jgi:hypothetical protein
MPAYPRRTKDTKRIEAVLGGEFEQVESFRTNGVSIRLRIVDTRFRKLSWVQREELVRPHLDQLPEGVVNDITVLLMYAPEELGKSDPNVEFEELLQAVA